MLAALRYSKISVEGKIYYIDKKKFQQFVDQPHGTEDTARDAWISRIRAEIKKTELGTRALYTKLSRHFPRNERLSDELNAIDQQMKEAASPEAVLKTHKQLEALYRTLNNGKLSTQEVTRLRRLFQEELQIQQKKQPPNDTRIRALESNIAKLKSPSQLSHSEIDAWECASTQVIMSLKNPSLSSWELLEREMDNYNLVGLQHHENAPPLFMNESYLKMLENVVWEADLQKHATAIARSIGNMLDSPEQQQQGNTQEKKQLAVGVSVYTDRALQRKVMRIDLKKYPQHIRQPIVNAFSNSSYTCRRWIGGPNDGADTLEIYSK